MPACWQLLPPPELAHLPARIAVESDLCLGRAPDCDLVLDDPAISRLHARLELRADGSLWLCDLGSRAGTRRNGTPLAPRHPVRLDHGDSLELGDWRFGLVLGEAGASEQAPEPATRLTRIERLGDLAEQRLALLLAFAAAQSAAVRTDDLLDNLLDYARRGSGYARGRVVEFEPERGALRSLRGGDADGLSRSLLAAAARDELAVLESPSPQRLRQSLLDARLKRALCVGLDPGSTPARLLYLDTDWNDPGAQADAPAFCHALARLTGLALQALARREAERERLALQAELERARVVQARLVPARREAFGAWRLALRLAPGGSVAGDLADCFALPDGRRAVLLGDVSGSGLGAGLVMATAQAFLRAALALEPDPAAALERLNRHLLEQVGAGTFVTLWLGLLAPDGRIDCIDAGHGHVLHLAADGIRPLASEGGVPLGVLEAPDYRSETLRLAPGQGLLLFSDGLVEQLDARGAAFGLGRVGQVLRDCDGADPETQIAALLQALEAHRGALPPGDDTTVLALRRG